MNPTSLKRDRDMDADNNDSQDAHSDREPNKRIKLDVADDAEQASSSSKPAAREKGAKRGRGRGRGRGRDNWKSRDWGPRTEPRAERAGDTEDGASSKQRLPKRKCALLLGFCGTGFNGMQRQARQLNARTIEGELFAALVKAGAISEDNADDPSKSQLQRSARTDSGVHAAGNVVSIKLITEVPGVPDLVAHINDLLPPSIRLWSIVRVQNSFSARTSCDSRKYTYVFPSHILLPPKPGSPLHSHLKSSPGVSDAVVNHPFWAEVGAELSPEEERRRKQRWRVGPAALDAFRAALAEYHGTHNFHNFTVQKEFDDVTTSRFIKTTEVPAPLERDGIEWISVLFHGQSFMLHQRKMISAALLLARTGTPPSLMNELYGPPKVHIPKAPALGLLLEYPLFESYNTKIEATVHSSIESERREPIDFAPLSARMDEFKEAKIYSEIRAREAELNIFEVWLRSIDNYSGDDFKYLGPSGAIPPEAVYVRGVPRPNQFRDPRKDVPQSASGGDARALEESDEDEVAISKKDLAEMEG
ncbi:pseudouridine synthase [Auricularia subglabra TFB-10046 SS5]|uniref:Pseudouridine synthase n=1 Tax=Auricularia subglabra (strain TFB-10046 / SS5) TaxID=717982 RepID=J0CVY8_AURST|nr:pseudouridine synthase [Auricularia subglabra TFB-10046 SS5]